MKAIHQLKEVSRTVNSLKLTLKVDLCLLMIRFTVTYLYAKKNKGGISLLTLIH
jgi:hypothetical protein